MAHIVEKLSVAAVNYTKHKQNANIQAIQVRCTVSDCAKKKARKKFANRDARTQNYSNSMHIILSLYCVDRVHGCVWYIFVAYLYSQLVAKFSRCLSQKPNCKMITLIFCKKQQFRSRPHDCLMVLPEISKKKFIHQFFFHTVSLLSDFSFGVLNCAIIQKVHQVQTPGLTQCSMDIIFLC